MNLPACMDQAGIIDSDDSNIEQARGCESTGIVKTGMMERTERQVVAILKHGTLDGSHATASVGNGEFLRRGLMRRLRSAITSGGTWSGISAARYRDACCSGTRAYAKSPHGGTVPATPQTPRPSHRENRR